MSKLVIKFKIFQKVLFRIFTKKPYLKFYGLLHRNIYGCYMGMSSHSFRRTHPGPAQIQERQKIKYNKISEILICKIYEHKADAKFSSMPKI